MKFVINDHRSEDRAANTRRDITGMVTEPEQSDYDRRHARFANHDRRKTNDSRDVIIHLEPEDYTGDLAVPVTLQGHAVGKHGGEFFVKKIVIRHTRSYSNDDETQDNWGRYGMIRVSGPNRRADGTEGAKDNGSAFPKSRDVDGPNLWTLKDVEEITWDFKPGDTLPQYKLDMIGTPKQVRVTDPLPDWLAAIVVRVHPRTGLAFAYGDEHRFGEFDSQPELQLATV
jgi:hypothetical protein